MPVNYLQGLFIIVNTFLSFYIVIYAYVFLSRTKDYPDRRPWELLFLGSIIFLITQVVWISAIYGEEVLLGINIYTLNVVCQFLYAALILIAFITQSQLILKSDMILITRRVQKRREEEAVKKRSKPKTRSQKEFVKLSKRMTPDEEIKFVIDEKELKKEMKEDHFTSELRSEEEIVEEDNKNSN